MGKHAGQSSADTSYKIRNGDAARLLYILYLVFYRYVSHLFLPEMLVPQDGAGAHRAVSSLDPHGFSGVALQGHAHPLHEAEGDVVALHEMSLDAFCLLLAVWPGQGASSP